MTLPELTEIIKTRGIVITDGGEPWAELAPEIERVWPDLRWNGAPPSQFIPGDIKSFIADCYDKAAFGSYVIGNFSNAVQYQEESIKFNKSSIYKFNLAKYQVRNNETDKSIKNLNDNSININQDTISVSKGSSHNVNNGDQITINGITGLVRF
jgi:hypothetical protein